MTTCGLTQMSGFDVSRQLIEQTFANSLLDYNCGLRV